MIVCSQRLHKNIVPPTCHQMSAVVVSRVSQKELVAGNEAHVYVSRYSDMYYCLKLLKIF